MVAVARAVARGGGVGAVEDDGDVAVTAVGVEAVDLGQHGTLEEACADDEECGVGHAVDDGGVGNNLNRRTVEEDVVVFVAERCDEGFETSVEEEFCGVGGYSADGNDVERRF